MNKNNKALPSPEKRTKIVATIGPACSAKETIHGMMLAGVNVFRLNFSHAKYEELAQVIIHIRSLDKELGTTTAILGDLQGPKIRIGEMENNGVPLSVGDQILMTTQPCIGNAERIYINYEAFPKDVKPGDMILLDDGKIKMEVLETNLVDTVRVLVIHGGILSSKKGVNLPNSNVSLPSLTEKDIRDLDFILEQQLDWVALSFVRQANDIYDLKARIAAKRKNILVVAKIEKPQAVANIQGIVAAADGIMVARGDLGVEYPIEKLPLIQKAIVKASLEMSKPVIIATQMMESMITSFMPTRAEANDVANAVLDGADALMLSGETSVGQHPIQVVEYMTKIIVNVEEGADIYYRNINLDKNSPTYLSDSLCYTAVKTAKHINAKAIVGMTKSGYTAYKVCSFRPSAKVFIFTPDRQLMARLALVWGVETFFYNKLTSTDETIQDVLKMLLKQGKLNFGDIVINTGSMPIQQKLRANMMKISIVD